VIYFVLGLVAVSDWSVDVAGVREVWTSDVRTLSCVRPAVHADHSDEERCARPATDEYNAARLAPQRGRRSTL